MILCSGCFDGLHAGHVRYLNAALTCRQPASYYKGTPEGLDTLTVAVASNNYILKTKGRPPRWSLPDRMATVKGVAGVDSVTVHDFPDVAHIIRTLKPRVFVKGADWAGRLPTDVVKACRDLGVLMVFVDSGAELHNSDALPPHQ